jgi:hypothetical protein
MYGQQHIHYSLQDDQAIISVEQQFNGSQEGRAAQHNMVAIIEYLSGTLFW